MLPLILKYSGGATFVFFMASHLVKEKKHLAKYCPLKRKCE